MKTITVVGTITKDIIHFSNNKLEVYGGAPWFAVGILRNKDVNLNIITNVGIDFSLSQIPAKIRRGSFISVNTPKTTHIDVYPEKKGVPGKVVDFTGAIKKDNFGDGDIAIISPLFNEVSLDVLKILRGKNKIVILDIQGFTRQKFKQNLFLNDMQKKDPKNLKQICNQVDLLKCSDNEFNILLKDKKIISEKLKLIHSWGVEHVIITKGKDGCLLSSQNREVKEYKTNNKIIKNTVGAGDKFLILVGFYLLKTNSIDIAINNALEELERIMY